MIGRRVAYVVKCFACERDDVLKHWEIIAEKLSASGLSWGCSSEIDATGRVLYTADAYRNDG
jgi:hypothetical protein